MNIFNSIISTMNSIYFVVILLLLLIHYVNPITQSFGCTGSVQNFIVPDSIGNTFTIQTNGAQGGSGFTYPGTQPGGNGAIISGNFNLQPGTMLYVYVGCTTTNGNGGFNGGGNAMNGGGGGGGASDVRLTEGDLSSRIIVAAGGGNKNTIILIVIIILLLIISMTTP